MAGEKPRKFSILGNAHQTTVFTGVCLSTCQSIIGCQNYLLIENYFLRTKRRFSQQFVYLLVWFSLDAKLSWRSKRPVNCAFEMMKACQLKFLLMQLYAPLLLEYTRGSALPRVYKERLTSGYYSLPKYFTLKTSILTYQSFTFWSKKVTI